MRFKFHQICAYSSLFLYICIISTSWSSSSDSGGAEALAGASDSMKATTSSSDAPSRGAVLNSTSPGGLVNDSVCISLIFSCAGAVGGWELK